MQGIKNLIAALAIAFTTAAVPTTSSATALVVGEPWGEFAFAGLGSTSGCVACTPSDGGNSFFLGDSPWTFTGTGFLIVQDAFLVGDQFEVFDGSNSLGLTSAPGAGGCGSNPVDCFSDPNSSHGIFALGAGDHSFTITVIAAPFGSGASYLCVDSGQGECGVGPIGGGTDVPEPTSIVLLGLGLAAGSFWVRRRQLNLKFALQRALAWRSSRQRKN